MIDNIFKEKTHQNEIFKLLRKNDEPILMAGPCAIESYDQLIGIAQFIKDIGVPILRGGAYKPRTSPNSFQGLREEGIKILEAVKKEIGVYCVTEAIDEKSLELVGEVADIIQIGSRNMQNFSLLTEVGRQNKPVLLKRGMAATIKEWIHAAEYIAQQGNFNIIMCERGIRSYNDYTRNTMDIAAIPIIKEETGLPVIADPSHGTGIRRLVKPLSLAALAAGADGLIIEVHQTPEQAVSDGDQTLDFAELKEIVEIIKTNKGNSIDL